MLKLCRKMWIGEFQKKRVGLIKKREDGTRHERDQVERTIKAEKRCENHLEISHNHRKPQS